MNLRRFSMMIVVSLLTAGPTLAQDLPRAPERSDNWKGLVATLALTACVVAVSVMGSKRTHQD